MKQWSASPPQGPSTHRLIDLRWGSEGEALALQVQRIDYCDALNTDFQLTAQCLAPSADIDVSVLLGRSLGFGLMTASGERRWFNGIITAARRSGMQGGQAQLKLQLGSALTLLEQRHACRVFQDMSVPDIVTALLDEHRQRNPLLAAAFHCTSNLLRQHAPRSYCVQFNESDRTFINRLLAEEGISYHFAFDLDQDHPRHGLCLSDSGLFKRDRTQHLHYRADTHEDGDHALQRWHSLQRLSTPSVALSSYDYASAQRLHGSDDNALVMPEAARSATLGLEDHQAQTLYYADGHQDLAHYARLRMQARELRARTWLGEGQLRALATGDGVIIDDHPAHASRAVEGRSFLVSGVHLEACNNLPGALLPDTTDRAESQPDVLQPGQCRTRFRAVPHDQALVPDYAERLHRPTVSGPQTATVVGPPGETVYTDALGRIRIQFHWQRPQDHPQGHAADDERASTWVRVAMPSAGDGFGHQFLPRIGQEVLVDFLSGDVDRPLVTGVLFNGRHAPPRFAGVGELPGNRALSGIQSREHGGEAYSELLFDDSSGQVAASLHASPHDSALHLGRLHTPRRDGQAEHRGEGAELRTDAALALRSTHGLLLSSHGRERAQGHQLDRQELLALLEQQRKVFELLTTLATEQQAGAATVEPQQALTQAVQAWGAEGGHEPVIAVSAAAGLVSATPASQLHVSQGSHDVIAGAHLQQTSGERMHLQAGLGMSLFAREGGIAAIANKGHLQLQSRSEQIQAHALQGVQISSEKGEIVIAAPVIRLVAADGSFLCIGGGVTGGSDGAIQFHGASHAWKEPRTDSWSRALPSAEPPVCLACLARAALRGAHHINLVEAA